MAMAEFVKFTLKDGSEIFFESAMSDLVAARGAPPDVADGGRLQTRLEAVAAAAEQVLGWPAAVRARIAPWAAAYYPIVPLTPGSAGDLVSALSRILGDRCPASEMGLRGEAHPQEMFTRPKAAGRVGEADEAALLQPPPP
jgi:hypothetical protein